MRYDIQRADLWKRISAFLFDAIITSMLVVGIGALLSVIFNYNSYFEMVENAEREVSEKYGVDFDISSEEYEQLSDEKKQAYIDANEEFSKNENVIYGYNMMLNLAMVIVSVSLLLGFLVLDFGVPMLLGNGRTLGKKIFGLAVIRSGGYKMSGQAHFIRSMIGKCAIETMVPVYILIMIIFGNLGIVGTGVLVLFAGLQIYAVASTRNKTAIHDLVSDTVAVDMASQMIFDTEAEMIEYKKKLHQEEAERKPY